VTGQDSLFLEPEATYPFVPGHELVGIAQSDVRGMRDGSPINVHSGDRVAVWPVLGCAAHAIAPPCEPCAVGWEGLCQRRKDSWPGYGLSIGFNRNTGGGWSEQCLAHASQLWPLPDNVSDEDALLLDPAAAGLAALLRTGSDSPDRTLIIGGGAVGLLTAWLHAQLGLAGSCELMVRHSFQKVWATERGLEAVVVRGENDFRQWAGDRSMSSAQVAGFGPVYRGCYDRVIDTAGTRSALKWAVRSVRPLGTVALISAPINLKAIDFTPIWYREISIRGINEYGPVPWQGQLVHPYSVLIPRLADGTLRLRDVITHEFPLADYITALATSVGRARTQAIKVIFRPGIK
jgi:L-iditol 2-dehydrogenase